MLQGQNTILGRDKGEENVVKGTEVELFKAHEVDGA